MNFCVFLQKKKGIWKLDGTLSQVVDQCFLLIKENENRNQGVIKKEDQMSTRTADLLSYTL